MRKCFAAVLAFLAVGLASLAPPAALGAGPAAGDPLKYLARLYKDFRYFELRDAVARLDGAQGAGLEFFRGAVDGAFNRLDSAAAHLLRFLDATAGAPPPLTKEAWVLLADVYRRSGQYRKSSEAQQALIRRSGASLSADERAILENVRIIWTALADVPPQTVEVFGDSVIPMEDRNVPVGIMGRTAYLAHDTGSSLSLLSRSAADRLGLVLCGPPVKIQAATGKWVEARLTVVPEMRLGETVVHHAVFLVFPDDFLSSRRGPAEDIGRDGLLGAPVLAALKEITETRDGRLLIPASPPPRSVQNMCFFGFTPIVEVVHRESRLPFILDTGASATFLNLPYFNRHRGELRNRTRVRRATIGGVGDSRMVRIFVLDEFDFKAGGLDLALRRVPVYAQATHACSRLFFGTLGLDLLRQCTRITFNFDSMSFILE